MVRKLKTYRTSLGFYDLAIAAPSMKAALEAWGAGSNLFHQGVARESDDPQTVAATMSKPGVVLRRAIGSDGPFREHPALPKKLGDEPKQRGKKTVSKPRLPPRADDKMTAKAALAFEKEQRRRQNQRRKEEAAREKQHSRRQEVIARARAALEKSEREHDKKVARIQSQREAIERKSRAEDTRWAKEKDKLERALHRGAD